MSAFASACGPVAAGFQPAAEGGILPPEPGGQTIDKTAGGRARVRRAGSHDLAVAGAGWKPAATFTGALQEQKCPGASLPEPHLRTPYSSVSMQKETTDAQSRTQIMARKADVLRVLEWSPDVKESSRAGAASPSPIRWERAGLRASFYFPSSIFNARSWLRLCRAGKPILPTPLFPRRNEKEPTPSVTHLACR